MANHPLTAQAAMFGEKEFGRYDGINEEMVYDEDEILLAWNLGADDLLDQVAEWMQDNLHAGDYLKPEAQRSACPVACCIKDLKEAMRLAMKGDIS